MKVNDSKTIPLKSDTINPTKKDEIDANKQNDTCLIIKNDSNCNAALVTKELNRLKKTFPFKIKGLI